MKKVLVPLSDWAAINSHVFKCSVCEHYIDRNGDVALPRDYTEFEINCAPLAICNICEGQKKLEREVGDYDEMNADNKRMDENNLI